MLAGGEVDVNGASKRTARATKTEGLIDDEHLTLHATSATQAVQSATLVGNRMILEVG